MIKIFTTDKSSTFAGDNLTDQFIEWKNSIEAGNNIIEIKDIHTNSNKFGWMLAVHYEIKQNNMKEKFTVELTFSGNLTSRQKDAVLENILNSLLHTVNTAGLVPDSCGSHTETIRVTRSGSNWSLGKNLITGDSIA